MTLSQPKRYVYLALALFYLAYIYLSLLVLFRQSSPAFLGFTVEWLAEAGILLFFQLLFIIFAWIGGGVVGGLSALLISCALVVFLSIVLQEPIYLYFIIYYTALSTMLHIYQRNRSNDVVIRDLESEKLLEEQNSLTMSLHEKTNTLSAFFEKYSNYFNLREIAQDFSTTLSLDRICELVLEKLTETIQKGDAYLLYLVDVKESGLSLTASRWVGSPQKMFNKQGDLCDVWCLKSRQHLIVTDFAKDFRFDLALEKPIEDAQSLIIAPIVDNEKIIGILRVQSKQRDTFAIEDLRLLDIIAGLAASAISNAQLFQRTSELAIHDSLTKLYVHQHFRRRLQEEQQRALIANDKLSVLMIDIDYFKKYNDRYGHAAGDLVLVQIADMIRSHIHEAAITARYGGEEFAVILPKTDLNEARQLAEKLRRAVEKKEFTLRNLKTPITISVGTSCLPLDTLDDEELIRIADTRLYEAKKSGRNRVC